MKTIKEAQILIVEDQEIQIRLLKGILSGEGYRNVIDTMDARQALPLFREFQPDLVLLGLHMPHFDGFEVMAQLSEFIWGDHLPILALSSELDAPTRQRALSCGATDFIIKPFKMADVLLRVNNVLQNRLLHLQLQAQQNLFEATAQMDRLNAEEAQIVMLERLTEAAESRTGDSQSHNQRVADLAAALGREMGMAPDEIALLRRTARLHDVGNIAVPDHILLKPGELSRAEYEIVQAHAEAGARLLQNSQGKALKMAEEIAFSHHEKWDGGGYPQGLRGEAIPLAGRIVALAEVFDALVSQRPHKASWPVEKARAEIVAQSGRHFDPAVVAAFLRFLENSPDGEIETLNEGLIR